MAAREADAGEVVLLLRACLRCHTLFVVCRSCYRGQRYCSSRCGLLAWWEQRRAANRRHQQSREGRADHRDRQRAYRKRCAQRRWAVPDGTAGESAVTECTAKGQLRVVELSIPNATLSSLVFPRSPSSQNEAVPPKNVTDKASNTLPSPDMMVAGNSGSATPLGGSVGEVAHRLRPPAGMPKRAWFRCSICGRRGCFVDPFP